jgi:translation elongation factor EF-Tu-like GTPase
MILLSKVEDVFEIEGRGCVLVPGIYESVLKNVVVRRGDPIELKKPDGSSVQTHVEAVEVLDRVDRTNSVVVVLPAEFSKRDIPIGTEIWLREDEKHSG